MMTDDEKRKRIMHYFNVALKCEKYVVEYEDDRKMKKSYIEQAIFCLDFCLSLQNNHPKAYGPDFKTETQNKLNSWKKRKYRLRH